MTNELSNLSLSLSLILRSTVSRPVCLGIKYTSGAYYQIFITVRQLQVCCCGTLSLTRGRVCRLHLLLVLSSAVILGSESRGTERPYFNVSESRLLFSSPPTSRKATAEMFDPASARDFCSVKIKVTLRLTISQSISQSVSLGVDPHLGLMTRYLLLFDSYGLVFVRRPL
jgi:hypothetical protein